ncbi:hypothetical protein ABT369_05405 [Dactylosporangium sp. NPDC000244]|uniref:hypothetical protein n=1 Tax=Dactylosporangium sp. NPDC000244 TaxID=3154365 RepID=UPI00332176CC
MSAAHAGDRALIARAAAHTRWAKTADRAAATAAARRTALERFEREVDPDGILEPHERARRAESARKAYFALLALKSAQARRANRGA